ncbi:MAG: signal recognition particle-docking protein FtsY [Oscillospiraceae bacterium]|nr:signal recognition particle-docking protein FtsY [Oscillospiraceae bacterium]
MGLFDKLKSALGGVFASEGRVDDDFFDELEETLILSDVGGEASGRIVSELRAKCKKEGLRQRAQAKDALKGILRGILESGGADRGLNLATRPSVILVIGVNGAGKTTSIGKLAAMLKARGKRVLLCAGDTFRAAAADQLGIWAGRAGVDIVRQHEGADPCAVLFDAISAAKARGSDVIICDTAGRLQNKQNLMNELNKISRIIDRELPGASRESLLVIDATTGQNGLSQARGFMDSAGLTGIILTKLDGSAKGGVVIAVASAMGVPVKLSGVGERIGDMREFDPEEFIGDIIG